MKQLKTLTRFWVLGLGFWALGLAANTLHLTPDTLHAASGCSYPASLHTWPDKITGDFLTILDVNQRSHCLELLQSGPLRPNDGTAAAPAYAFQGNATLGLFRQGANAMGFSSNAVEVARLDATGIIPAGSGILKANRTTCTGADYLKPDGTCGGVGSSSFGSIGQDSKNNTTTPNTQFDLYADVVVLRDTNNNTVVRFNPGTITNNVSTAGPAANGRDQAGAFSASSWIHFYWIWNGTTLATLSSIVIPPTGPTLPSGYTHWSYAGAVRFNASSQLVKTRIKKSLVSYEVATNALSAGTSTTEATVGLSALIPPNASAATLLFFLDGTAALTSSKIRYVSGSDYATLQVNAADVPAYLEVPNVSQQIFYINSSSSLATTIDVLGYEVPNGGA